jgi:hypothetical protein
VLALRLALKDLDERIEVIHRLLQLWEEQLRDEQADLKRRSDQPADAPRGPH